MDTVKYLKINDNNIVYNQEEIAKELNQEFNN